MKMMTMTMTTTMKEGGPRPTPARRAPRRGPLSLALPLTLLLPLLLVAPSALAGQQIERIDERRPLQAGATVTIETLHHRVEVERWDRAEIHLTGDYDAGYEEPSASGDARNFRFRIHVTRDFRGEWNTGAREPLRVRLPHDAHLHVKTVSGSIRVPAGRSEVELESVSGSIELGGSHTRARLSSVSGSITARGSADDIRIQNVSGAISLEGEHPRFEARSVSGAVRVEARRPVSHGIMNAVSGRIHFEGAMAGGGELSAESHSGPVELALAGTLDARFRMNTFSGRLRAEIPGRTQEEVDRGRFTPNERMTFVVGGGSGRIDASSFSGNVTIRPAG